MRRWLIVAAAVAAAGCSTEQTAEEREFDSQMYLGDQMYKGSKFEEAVRAYARAAQLQNSSFKANLGLAQAAAELSLTLYSEADRLASINKRNLSEEVTRKADEFHEVANKAFAKAQQLHPSDTIVNYYLGLMLYKRATTPYGLPYPANPVPPKTLKDPAMIELYKSGVAQRRKERDAAIEQFEKVLRNERTATDSPDHPQRCSSPQAHRYLALAYLTRSDLDKSDIESFRKQLGVYLAWLEGFRANIVKNAPNKTQEEKAAKEQDLAKLDRELLDVREILLAWRENLVVLERQIHLNLEECPIPLEKRPQRLQSIVQEKLLIEGMIAQFDKVREAPKKP